MTSAPPLGTEAPTVPTGRSAIAVLDHDGQVYLFGGKKFAEPPRTFDTAERFDARTGRCEALPRMPTARLGLGAGLGTAMLDSYIYVVSGGPRPAFAFGDANERLRVPAPVAGH